MKTIVYKFQIITFFILFTSIKLTGQSTIASSESEKLDAVVGEFTGVLNVNMPLMSVSNGSLSVGISLSYVGNGLRPNQASSVVGLGWELNTGYMISRQILGKADDIGTFNTSTLNYQRALSGGLLDPEFDIFRLQMPNFSGEFIQGTTFNNFKTLQTSELKISYNTTTNNFTVVSNDGSSIIFIPGIWKAEFNSNNNYSTNDIIGWVPYKIISYDKKDTISFIYGSNEFYSHYVTLDDEKIAQKTKVLSRIVGLNDQIELNWTSQRNDVITNGIGLLDKIKYTTGNKCFEYLFFIEDMVDNNNLTSQMRLKEIWKGTCDNIGDPQYDPPTSFEYYGPINSLGQQFAPKKTVTGIDSWGYYNGHNSNPVNDLLPPISIRSVDFNSLIQTSLKSITSPLGKKTTYEYESNQIGTISSVPSIIGPAWTCDPLGSVCPGTNSASLPSIYLNETAMLQGYLNISLKRDIPPITYINVMINCDDGNSQSISLNSYEELVTIPLQISSIIGQNGTPLFKLNRTYNISVTSTDGNGSVEFIFTSTILPRVGPGLRVKKITESLDNGSTSQDIITNYKYTNGALLLHENGNIKYQNKQYNIAGNIKALNFLSGLNLGYEVVETYKTGQGKNVKLFDISYSNEVVAGTRNIMDIYKGGFGNLLSTSIFGETGLLLSKDSFEYVINSSQDVVNGLNIKMLAVCSNPYCTTTTSAFLYYKYSNVLNRLKKKYSYYYGSLVSTSEFDYSYTHTIQPKSITTISGSQTTVSYLDYTNNIWSNSEVKNKFIGENVILPYISNNFINGVFQEGKRTDFAFYSSTGSFVGGSAGGNTSHIIRPSTKFMTRKDGVATNGIEYADHYFHSYSSDGLIHIDQKANWPSTTYLYDRKRLISTNNNGFVTTNVYIGNTVLLDRKYEVDGRYLINTYDGFMRLSKTEDILTGVTKIYEYNFFERHISETATYPAVAGSAINVVKSKTYMDQMGRTIAVVKIAASPSQKDVISAVEYDQYGRKIKDYLPFETTYSDGTLVPIPSGQKFSLTVYEASPLNRVKEVIPPDWYATKYEYGLNSNSEVSGYAGSTLTKDLVIDGNGNRSYTFKDFAGRLILSRKADPANNVANHRDTWYTYDGYNRVTMVIPPGATSGDNNLTFNYTYNQFDQILTKKVPDRGVEIFDYNDKKLLAARRHSTMPPGQYISYQYDLDGREIKTGLTTSLNVNSPSFSRVYTENIYGTTAFLKNKIITSKVNILGTSTYLETNLTYDNRGRIIESKSNTHKNLTIFNTTTFTYDNNGNVLSTSTPYTGLPDNIARTLASSSTYDHQGRLIDDSFKYNQDNSQVLSTNEYNFRNELVRVRQGKVGSTGNYLQDIDFTYRTNGMLEKMNQPTTTGSDLFYMEYFYDNPVSGTTAISQKNGNIANLLFQRKGANMMGFAYGYSVHNELTSADFSTFSNTGVPSSSSAYDESFTYDVRGNINTLLRNDQNGLSIDNLQYFYNTASNRSKSVYDHAVNIAGHNNNGKALGADIYSYDINGNLTTDPYRGVITNVYNHLDLPTTVAKSASNRMVMTYDATGRLLTRKTYTTSSSIPSETREYIGPFEYVNGTLDFIQTSQGRYKNISGNLRHEYVINDHLGSARIWYADVNNNGFTDQSEILDENHYYAYGMEMQGSFINSTGFNYKFNGIERVESYNMDFALYRGLDPVLGKWYQVDPKAEQAGYHMSPYCAMNNNPVTYADPEGDIAPLLLLAIGAATGVLSNGLSNISNDQNFFAGSGKAAFWGAYGAAASFGVGEALLGTGSFGHELLRAGAHGLTQGGISAAQGGNFWQGALSGSIGSGISSGIDALGGTAGHQILGGGLGGGIGSAISGGNFWQGFGQGVAVGAFNHALHSGLSEGGGEDPPAKKSESKLRENASFVNDFVGLEADVALYIANLKVKANFATYEELLRSMKISRKIKAVGTKLGKVTGILGLVDTGVNLLENYNQPSAYLKAGVEVGTFVYTKNPYILIAKGFSDITGFSDYLYKKID
jgi:RHS repeat-associated protein